MEWTAAALLRSEAGSVGVAGSLAAAVVLADAFAPPQVSWATLLLAVPLVVSTVARPARTALSGLASFVLAGALLTVKDVAAREVAVRLVSVAVAAAIAVLLAAGRRRREQRMDDLDRFATLAQELIVRPVPARLGNVYAAGRYVAASDVLAIGGDLYDVAFTHGGVRFIIGDACGKGLSGIRLASQVLTRFREGVYTDATLPELAGRLDSLVAEMAEQDGDEGEFVTAILGELHEDGELVIANCGHPDGVIAHDGRIAVLSPPARTVPLGLGAEPRPHRIQVATGDRFLWWTDGVSEARDAGGEFLEVESAAVTLATSATLQQGVDALLERLREHAVELSDDVAVLAFELGAAHEHRPGLRSVLADRRDATADDVTRQTSRT